MCSGSAFRCRRVYSASSTTWSTSADWRNRSKAIAEMISHFAIKHREEQGDTVMAGMISLVYDEARGRSRTEALRTRAAIPRRGHQRHAHPVGTRTPHGGHDRAGAGAHPPGNHGQDSRLQGRPVLQTPRSPTPSSRRCIPRTSADARPNDNLPMSISLHRRTPRRRDVVHANPARPPRAPDRAGHRSERLRPHTTMPPIRSTG